MQACMSFSVCWLCRILSFKAAYFDMHQPHKQSHAVHVYWPCCGRTCIVVHSWMVCCLVCTWQQYWEELVTLFTISRWLLKAREVSVLTDGRGPSLLLHVTLYGTHNWPSSSPLTDTSHTNSTLSPSNTTDPRELVSAKEVSASSSLHNPLPLLPLPIE